MEKISQTLLLISFLFFFLQGKDGFALEVGASKDEITPLVETFQDQNKNGRYDLGESFQDINGNGKWDPVYLAGYGTGRIALGVHDPLWARSMVVTDDSTTVIFIAVDVIGIFFDEVELIEREIEKKWNIPKENIFLASTHDHSGPDTLGLWGVNGSGKDPYYMDWLRSRILNCVGEALKNRQSARLAFGQVSYSTPIEDARPPKVIDDHLLSLQALDLNGNTIATLVNYALHAEVLNQKNRLITSDYPGVLREELEKKLGGIALFFPGDIGGMQTPRVFFHSFSNRKKIGRALACKVIRSLKVAVAPSPITIDVKSQQILLPIENPRFLNALQSGIFGTTKDHLVFKDGKLNMPSKMNIARIGPALFVSLPGELFPESGNKLRKEMPYQYLFLLGLCNNEIGYIVPKEEWNPLGYEESMSLGKKTDGIVLDTLLKLTDSLRSKP